MHLLVLVVFIICIIIFATICIGGMAALPLFSIFLQVNIHDMSSGKIEKSYTTKEEKPQGKEGVAVGGDT